MKCDIAAAQYSVLPLPEIVPVTLTRVLCKLTCQKFSQNALWQKQVTGTKVTVCILTKFSELTLISEEVHSDNLL